MLAGRKAAAGAVAAARDGHADWGPSGNRPDQYASDVVADEAVRGVLLPLGYGLLSEESAVVEPGEGCPVVVVDPLDGSTNASREFRTMRPASAPSMTKVRWRRWF